MMNRKVTVILIGLLLLGLTASTQAKLPKEQTNSLFVQANEAFRNANAATGEAGRQKHYEKAILNFEKIINDGQINNAGLFYNLGNVYFLKGDLGKAILNYRRAEKLDSADANIQKNLAFARSRRIDKIKVKTQKRVLQTLFFWHYDFSTRTRFTVTCISFAVLCIGLTVFIWFGRNAPTTAAVIISGILTVCFFTSVVLEARGQASRVCGVITAESIVARQGDGPNYQPSFKEPLHGGTEFDLLEQRPGWLHIKLSDDSDSWIPQSSAETI